MSNLWLEIETLVLDGVPMNPAQGRRLAELTEIALTRLLEQRGVAARMSPVTGDLENQVENAGTESMRVPGHANEARWAEELALTLYRAMDRAL